MMIFLEYRCNNMDIQCKLCSIDELPLKKFKRNEWFHVTCLVLNNMSEMKNFVFINFDFVYIVVLHKSNNFLLKNEREIDELILKNETRGLKCIFCGKEKGKNIIGICLFNIYYRNLFHLRRR